MSTKVARNRQNFHQPSVHRAMEYYLGTLLTQRTSPQRSLSYGDARLPLFFASVQIFFRGACLESLADWKKLGNSLAAHGERFW